MKARLPNFAITLAVILITCAVMEVGLRVFGSEVLMLGDPYIFYKFDPVLGWSGLPNRRGPFIRAEFGYPVEVNSLGMRDREVAEKRAGEFRVAVLGDSFTWGVGAAYGERFTEIIEALDPRINALNFGVSGYSPIQYLLEIDQVLAFKPDYVIVAFCLGNDLLDNVLPAPYQRPKPYARLSADGSNLEIVGYPLAEPQDDGLAARSRLYKLVKNGVLHVTRRWTRKPLDLDSLVLADTWLYVPSERLTAPERKKVADAYKVNELLLDAIRQRVDDTIGPNRFAVLLAPSKSDYGLTPRLGPDVDSSMVAEHMLRSLSSLGIPAIDGRSAIAVEDFWTYDAHWRPSGHAKIGRLLADHLAGVIAQPHAAAAPRPGD